MVGCGWVDVWVFRTTKAATDNNNNTHLPTIISFLLQQYHRSQHIRVVALQQWRWWCWHKYYTFREHSAGRLLDGLDFVKWQRMMKIDRNEEEKNTKCTFESQKSKQLRCVVGQFQFMARLICLFVCVCCSIVCSKI